MKRFRRKMMRGERGFTLIELLVVIAILGILAVIAVPRVQNAVDNARMSKGRSDMRIIASSLDRFYFDNYYYPVKLMDLKPGYIKTDFNFKNSYDKYYFYAVRWDTDLAGTALAPRTMLDPDDLSEYILGDPGRVPGTLAQWSNTSTANPVPEGLDPTTDAYFFGIDDFETKYVQAYGTAPRGQATLTRLTATPPASASVVTRDDVIKN